MKKTKIAAFGASLLLIVITLLFFLVPSQKELWDERVAELCAEDGGLSVTEPVYLSEREYRGLAGTGSTITVPAENSPSGVGAP